MLEGHFHRPIDNQGSEGPGHDNSITPLSREAARFAPIRVQINLTFPVLLVPLSRCFPWIDYYYHFCSPDVFVTSDYLIHEYRSGVGMDDLRYTC
jgi:hypothetical protein